MKRLFYFLLVISVAYGCENQLTGGFNQTPKNKISPQNAFKTENELKMYINNLYSFFPSGNSIVHSDNLSDFVSKSNISSYLTPGAYDAKTAGGWNWGHLRTINYFLVNAPQQAKKAGIRKGVIENYVGIARLMRARFYFKKVKKYGKVPWYSKPLDPSDSTELHKSRDSRKMVMDSVLADLDYAVAHIDDEKDNTASTVTKWVALAFKSRVGLFEGTYRKYHPELNLQNSAEKWLNEAVDAAKTLMESGVYSIHVDQANPELSYRELFTDESGHPPSDETLLAYNCSSELGVYNATNHIFTQASYGGAWNLSKQFINTYLDIDGTQFTDKKGYQTMPFWEEVKNRDLRLQQTIRLGDYKRADGTPAPPDFSYTMTGYQPIKFTLDKSEGFDNSEHNDNSIPIIRYAEVLLNYAEAKKELRVFTFADWDKTIKVLRQRAGITNTAVPTQADPYLQKKYFPDISDPVLLEIRRERGLELVLEGFRFDDLRRWDRGKLLEMPYKGMYVPKMNKPLDLNQDGMPDVNFVKKVPENKITGIKYVVIGDHQTLTERDKGNLLWNENQPKVWKDYKKLYPIPYKQLLLNPKLKQNPGWEIN